MSEFGINNRIDQSQSNPQKPAGQQEGVTREQFINNIFGGANSTKAPDLVTKANSIFNQLDNSPKDGALSQSEINKGAPMISVLKDLVNVAIGGVKNTQETSKDSPNVDYINSLSPEEQAKVFTQELDEKKASGCKFKSFDGEIIEGIDANGKKFTISLVDGVSDEVKATLDKVVTEYMANDLADAAGVNLKDQIRTNNLTAVINSYEAKGFYPDEMVMDENENCYIGTLKNEQGEEIKIKIDIATGKEIKDE